MCCARSGPACFKPSLHLAAAGLEAPAEAQSFFDSLYRAGRLRAFAGAGWAAHQAGGPRSVTDFQRQVGAFLTSSLYALFPLLPVPAR